MSPTTTKNNTPSLEDMLAQIAGSDDDPSREVEQATRDLVKVVQAALNGQRIRGLPNLGTEASPFFGVNITGDGLFANTLPKWTQKIPFPSKEEDEGERQLVFTEQGEVVWVRAIRRTGTPGTTASQRTWFDFSKHSANLKPSQLLHLVQHLPGWLEAHLKIMEREKVTARAAVKSASELVAMMERVVDSSKRGR